MSEVDNFLSSLVTPTLQPGEAVRGMALLRIPLRRHKITNIPEVYGEYLGVATDRRLITFATEIGGFITPTVKAVATSKLEWWFDEIASVDVRPVFWPVAHSGGSGVEMTITPHPGCGPFLVNDPMDVAGAARNYNVYAAADGLDAQAAFFHQFPAWLKGAVAAGTFPMSAEKRAATDARIAERKVQFELYLKERAADRAKAGSVFLRVAVGFVGLLFLVFGAAFVRKGVVDIDNVKSRAADTTVIDIVKGDLAWAQSGAKPTGSCQQRFHYRHLPPGTAQCRGCTEYPGYPKPPPVPAGYRRFEYGRGELHCPPPPVYQAELAFQQKALEDSASRTGEGTMLLVVGVVLGLVGLLGNVAFFVLVGRKKRAA